MRDARFKKIVGDLVADGARTALVMLAIATGIFAFSSVLDAQVILSRELEVNYARTVPSEATLSLGDSASVSTSVGLGPDILRRIRSLPGVSDALLCADLEGRIRVPGGKWIPLNLFVVPDYLDQRMDLITSVTGSWPPREGEVLVERAAVGLLGSALARDVEIRLCDGVIRTVSNSGVAHAPGLAPAWMERTVYAWVSRDTAARWGGVAAMNSVKLRVSNGEHDRARIAAVASRVRAELESIGIPVEHTSIPVPGRHPHATQMLSLLFLLESFGLLAMALSAILCASTIAALMNRQVREIAIMKAVGGSSSQIALMYFAKIALFAGLSCAAALPLAYRVAVVYAKFSARLLNFTLFDCSVPPWAYALEIATAFVVPLAVAAFPVIRGSRLSVREGLSDSGTRAPRGDGISARGDGVSARGGGFAALGDGVATNSLLSSVSRPLAFSVRNAFRKPARLMLTVFTLAAAGAIFMTAMNIGASMDASVVRKFDASRYDLKLRLSSPIPDADFDMVLGLSLIHISQGIVR